ncbi:MAG: FG-GAP repeat protein, partial [Rhizobiaceae bacterium]|nr:FG-GAP repeat protein [Rhizobiaceae bacterium]
GFDDIIVGAPGGDDGGYGVGEAYVIFGTDGTFGTDVSGRQVLDLTTLTAAQGFIIQGDTYYDYAGRPVSAAGDINGDGFDDLIVGALSGDDGGINAGEAYVIFGGNFSGDTTPVKTIGSSDAEMFIGGAGDDRLDGRGGADRFRAGAGDDVILVGSDEFRFIHAGTGQDTVSLFGSGITIDARDWSGNRLSGIETFDLTGTGDNTLILEASDVFHFSTIGNSSFTAADSHNNLVVLGNAGDSLELIDYASSGAAWELDASGRTLAGKKKGAFDFYNLTDGNGDVLASVAVDSDVSVVL